MTGRGAASEDRRMTTAVETAPGRHDAARRRARATCRRLRRVRHHRRPGEGDDAALALPPRGARAADLPDRRRRRRRLDGRRPARACPRGDPRVRRDARPGGVRPVRRPPLLPGGRLRGPGDVRAPRGEAEGRAQPGLLPRDPAVPVRRGGEGAGGRGPDRARACRRREAVRPRPRVRACARRGDARVPRRAPALPDRPLPREARPRRDPPPAVRERDPRAGLAPQPGRERPDHDGRELRRRGPRALLRPGRRAARRGGQPPHAGRRGGGDGGSGRARSRTRSRTPCSRSSTRCRRPTRPTTSAASTTGTARSTASPPDSTTETYAALRLEIDNWRWSGVPFFIRTGKHLPITQTELRLVFKRPPRLGFAPGPGARRRPARRAGSIPRPACG